MKKERQNNLINVRTQGIRKIIFESLNTLNLLLRPIIIQWEEY